MIEVDPKKFAELQQQYQQDDETETFLKQEEGFRTKPYRDVAGYSTTGVGHLIKPDEQHLLQTELTPEQANQLLKEDIKKHQTFLSDVQVPLTPNEKTALTSLAFNLGPSSSAVRRVVEALNAGDKQAAAEVFSDPVYASAGGQYYDSLAERRERERALFMQGAPSEQVLEVDPAKFEAIKSRPEISELESVVRGLAQGASFGFADELTGAFEAATGEKTYTQARDESRAAYDQAEKANPKSYLTGNIGGSLLGMFIPGMGWVNAGKGLAGAVAAGAVVGGAEALGRTAETELPTITQDVLKGAVLGAAFGGVVGGIAKTVARSSLPDAGKKILMDTQFEAARNGAIPNAPEMIKFLSDGDTTAQIWNRTIDKMNKLGSVEKRFPGMEQVDGDFVNSVMLRPAGSKVTQDVRRKFNEVMAGLTSQGREERWMSYLTGQKMNEAMLDVSEQYANSVFKNQDPLGMSWFKYLKDPMFTARQVDHKLGTNLEGVVAQFSEAGRRTTTDAAPYLKRVRDITERSKGLFKSNEDIGRILDGQMKATPEQEAIVGEWRNWFDDARQLFRKQGINVRELSGGKESYFPMKEVDPATMYTSLRRRYEELFKGPQGYRPGLDEEFDRAIMSITDGVEPRNTQQVQDAIESLLSPEIVKKNLGADVGAAMRRTGEVPDIVREYDPSRVATRYLMGNLKAGYMKGAYENLNNHLAVLRGLGMKDSEAYFNKYFSRMSNEPSSYYAYIESMSNKWKAHWDKVLESPDISKLQKAGATVAKALPDFLSWQSSVIYPNVLGWNVYAPIRNMTQTWMTTAPELGGTYGMKVTGRGWLRAAEALRKGQDMEQFLQARGLLGGSFEGEGAVSAVKEGLKTIPGLEKLVGGIDSLGELGMRLYTKSDTANRFITHHIATELAADMLAGKAQALQFAKSLPPGIKADLMQALRQGEAPRIGEMLSAYLNRKTQFDYGKAGLSMFGQDFGRLASMFLKWPQMVVSDMTELVNMQKSLSGKVKAPVMKYGTPLALLAAGQAALDQVNAFDKPAVKLILGNGLVSWSPVSSVFGLERPSPLVSLPFKTLGAANDAVNGELKQAAKKIRQAYEPFLPGIGMVTTAGGRVKRALEGE